MTQPYDPYDPPSMGLGLRAGMFSGAMACPRCGFATSDPNIYECPNCQMVWRERPKQIAAEVPKAGAEVDLVCAFCGQGFDNEAPVLNGVDANGVTLAHPSCMKVDPAAVVPDADVPDGYLQIVQATPPKRKRKRRRKRKPAAAQPAASAPEPE